MVSTVESFKELEFQLYGEMIQLRELHKALNNESEVAQISKVIDTLKTRTFRVAVVGEFKRGKSSLINALLGSVILPADVTPATATINRITYGTDPLITVCYHDGTTENIDIKSLPDYVTMLTPEGLQRASKIREAVVYYPTSFCQNHIELIDTPGLCDNEQMTRVTLNLLASVDAAIVVISALAPFSETEARFVADLIVSEKIRNLVFAVTYIDEVDEDRQDELIAAIHRRIQDNVVQVLNGDPELSANAQAAQAVLQDTRIFGVSSKLALKAFISNSGRMLKESRFEFFKAELYNLLTSRQGIHTLNASIDAILSGCDAYEKAADAELARTGDQLNKAVQLLGEVQQHDRQSIANANEALSKVKTGLMDVIKAACGQMERQFFQLFQQTTGLLQAKPGVSSFEVQKAVSEVSFKCYNIANNKWNSQFKDTVIREFKKCVGNLLEQRRNAVAGGLETLKREYPVAWKESSLFSIDQDGVFNTFGYPSFAYQTPVMPAQKTAVPAMYRPTALHSVQVSLQTLEKHWNIYCDSAKKWWMKAFTDDAAVFSENMDKLLSEIENKKKEREFQQIQMNCQRNNIRAIRSRAESIRLRIQA
jgi:hypothetical protein